MRRIHHRAARWAGPTAFVATIGMFMPTAALAATEPSAPTGGGFITFDIRAVGAVFDFDVLVPDALPLKVNGGVLSSTAQAKLGPQAFGAAGIAPVPVLNSVGIIIPEKVPVLDVPIPKQFQDALKSIDYTKLPAFCQASFPAAPGGSTSNSCGGPTQDDGGLGFTASGASGKVVTEGDEDLEASAKVSATSSGTSGTLTALGADLGGFRATALAGLNDDGIPEADSTAEVSSVSLLAGALKLEGLRSSTMVASDGTKEGTAGASSFSIGKATLLGIPITIGPNGITAPGTPAQGGDVVAALTKQVESLLGVQGFELKTFPGTPLVRSGSQTTMSSGGVSISFNLASPQINFNGRFGFTNANVTAVPEGGVPSPGAPPAGPVTGGPSTGGPVTGEPSTGDGTSGLPPGLAPGVSTGTDGLGGVTSGGVEPAPEFPPLAAGEEQQAGNQDLLRGVRDVALSSLSDGKVKNIYFAFMCLVLFAGALRYGTRVAVLNAASLTGAGLRQRLPQALRR